MEALDQLPRGRHTLSREAVARSQRDRLLRAMADAVSERGYARTPVAEVLRRARVSRETFYENFANKEECFLAAYDAAAAIVLDALTNAFGGARREADDRLDRVIEEYLAALTREPRFARTFLVEVYAAGPAALIRRATVQRRFVEAIIGLVGAGNDEQRFACEAIVAATSALVTQRICAQASADLGDLHGPLSRYARASLAAAGIAL